MDKLTFKAKKEGYNARSVYKLFAINNKYSIIKQNDLVLDLGCWPGGWLQACLKYKSKVIGIDLQKTDVPGAETFVGDITQKKTLEKIKEYGDFDVVISDMAPKTTGNIDLDQYKSYLLSLRAFEIAKLVLKKKGNFLVKIFQGEDSDKLLKELKKSFSVAKPYKPDSSKKRSKEVYFVGLGYNG